MVERAHLNAGLAALALLLAAPAEAQAPTPDGQNVAQRFQDGTDALTARNYLEAENDFKDVLQENPHHVLAHMMLGMLYVSQQNYPGAKKEFETVGRLNPRTPDALGRIGWVDAKMGDVEGAKKERTALETWNRSCAASHCRSAFAISAGLLMIDSVMTTAEGAGHEYGAGIDAIQARDWDTAEADFNKVLHENPKNPGAMFMLGIVRIAQHRYPEARKLLEAALKLDPDMPDAAGRLGWVDGQLGDLAAARKQRAAVQQMDRSCHKTCVEAITITEALWMIDNVLPKAS